MQPQQLQLLHDVPDVPFAVEELAQVEHDFLEARAMYRTVKRIFLLNGDAFSLGFFRLEAIGQKILDIFPEIETIASYASIESIARKTASRRIRWATTCARKSACSLRSSLSTPSSSACTRATPCPSRAICPTTRSACSPRSLAASSPR